MTKLLKGFLGLILIASLSHVAQAQMLDDVAQTLTPLEASSLDLAR